MGTLPCALLLLHEFFSVIALNLINVLKSQPLIIFISRIKSIISVIMIWEEEGVLVAPNSKTFQGVVTFETTLIDLWMCSSMSCVLLRVEVLLGFCVFQSRLQHQLYLQEWKCLSVCSRLYCEPSMPSGETEKTDNCILSVQQLLFLQLWWRAIWCRQKE